MQTEKTHPYLHGVQAHSLKTKYHQLNGRWSEENIEDAAEDEPADKVRKQKIAKQVALPGGGVL